MRKVYIVFNCFIGAMVSLLGILTCNFLFMLFSSGEDGRRTAYFNTIFFESITGDKGGVDLSLGFTGEVVPLILTLAIIFSFFLVVCTIYNYLQNYKFRLLDEKNDSSR